MLILNLVSGELKKEIKLRHLYQLIKKLDYVLVIITVVIAIILLVARVILQNSFNQIVEQTTLVTKNNQSYNSKIREINSKLKFVANVQKEFIVWSDVVTELSAITPENVSLNYVKFDQTAKTVKIRGKAKERAGLLKFKENLEQTSSYQNIQFPIKNILEKENIDFEINAALNL